MKARYFKRASVGGIVGLAIATAYAATARTAENTCRDVSAKQAYQNGTLFLDDPKAKSLRPKEGYVR
jgi:hypothetical protein